MEVVKVQLIESKEIAEVVNIHSESLKTPSLSNSSLCIQTPLIPHNIPGSSQNGLQGSMAHRHSLLEAGTVQLCSWQLEFAVGAKVSGRQLNSPLVSTLAVCEGKLLCSLQRDGGRKRD